ncbi:hypothetical protein [Devosia sp. CAU 1758]
MTDRTELDHTRNEIRAEISLLNSRLNALISSQSFLVIAYGSALAAAYDDWANPFIVILPPILAILGLVLVLEARPGIFAAQEAMAHWREREERLIDQYPELTQFTLATDGAERERMHLRQHAGTKFSTRVPLILLAAWGVFFALPFILYFLGISGP